MIDDLLTLLLWALVLCVFATLGCFIADGHLTRALARAAYAWSGRVLGNMTQAEPLTPMEVRWYRAVLRLHRWALTALVGADA